MHSDSDNTPLSSSEESLRIKELVKEALTAQLGIIKKRSTEKELTDSLRGVMGEFLDCFILMGYDFEGEPKVIKIANSKMSDAALRTLFIKVFAAEIQGYEEHSGEDF